MAANVQPLLEGLLDRALARSVRDGGLEVSERIRCILEEPLDPQFGDLTCRVAMGLARASRQPAPMLATLLVRHVEDPGGWLDRIEAAGPGFINLHVSLRFWGDRLREILSAPGPLDPSAMGVARPATAPGGQLRVALVRELLERMVTEASGGADDRAPIGRRRFLVVEKTRRVRPMAARNPGTAGGPDRTTVVRVGPTTVMRRGRPVDVDHGARLLGTAAGQLVLAAIAPGDAAVVDAERVEGEGVDNPLVLLRHALHRLRDLPNRTREADLGGLDDGDRECLRLAATLEDTIDWSVRCAEPDRLVRHVIGLAVATHRYYNRGRLEQCDDRTRVARETLLCGVERTLRRGLALLGIEG